jgi:UDP-4-amino-4,6-dideoxy-N-acetyl-beta-L-altrosamine N-acetyltransferase
MVEENIEDGFFRKMTFADLEKVLLLRNHSEVRRYMLTNHEISLEEHTLWFERALKSSTIELFVFEINSNISGFMQFKESNFKGVLDWGFYTSPEAIKGTGRKLGLAALKHAFKNEKIHKICGQSLHWNLPSISFHKSLGFSQEGIFHEHHFDGSKYHDMICFGLLKKDWVSKEYLIGVNK